MTRSDAERRACIEPDVGQSEYERIFGEPRIGERIFNDQGPGCIERMCAKGARPRGERDIEPCSGGEELVLAINDGDQADWNVKQRCRERHNVVELHVA